MKIPVENIYYLLCYAWNTLDEGGIVPVAYEQCRTPAGLLARVLEGGVTHLLKRGLDREYVVEEEDTCSLRGKLDVSVTVKRNLLRRGNVHCSIDSLSHDVTHNQIIRATIRRLIRLRDLDRTLRERLLRLYRRLHGVTDIELSAKHFDGIQLHRNNSYYRFLLSVCRLIHDNLLVDEQTGEARFRDFLRDEKQMAVLFEKFVRNFYRIEQDEFQVSSQLFEWQLVESSSSDACYLPRMKTDVSLDSPDRKLVIDTKYYLNSLQSYFGSESVHSGNLYQLFAYLKNLQVGDQRPIDGMLLYPTSGKSLSLRYRIQGHVIRIETLDLDASWKSIRKNLIGLLERA